MTSNDKTEQMVNLTIDGKPVSVPRGTNIIDAALKLHVEIPYYCYHPHLSVAGNCRMCQVAVKGQPKLTIGCNTQVQEGMEVETQLSNKDVAKAQASTLEFILINHPLDCTVCDQAGHCKLQDYHFRFNAQPSRFLEEKEHKPKAKPVGPNVMLDAERCILCTRCVRFCDEVTGTSELGMLNRGDRAEISVNEGKVLDNPLSGSVVDLCPVGALTHRNWRFNTRIWFTKQTDSICPGCSTGCNVKVAVRDKEVVQVKARENACVNKEWLCDEGRYGFHRFLPAERINSPLALGQEIAWDEAIKTAESFESGKTLVMVSPDLLLEEYWLLKRFIEAKKGDFTVALAYRERKLTDVEAILISPDYAANFKASEFAGLCEGNLQQSYENSLKSLREGNFDNLIIVGERGIFKEDLDEKLIDAASALKNSLAIISDAAHPLAHRLKLTLPERTILEKSGLMINRSMRLQYSDRVVESPANAEAVWQILNKLAIFEGKALTEAIQDRELTLAYLQADERLKDLKIKEIKEGGVSLQAAQG